MLYSIYQFKCVISSRNTLIDTPRIMFHQMSGHPGDPVKLTHKIALPHTKKPNSQNISFNYEGSNFSTTLTTLLIIRLFYYNHSSGCEVVLHCCVGLHSLMAKWSSVHAFISHSCIFFGKILIHILSPFLNWVVSFYYRVVAILYIQSFLPFSGR